MRVRSPRAVGLILWESAAFSAPSTSLESEAARGPLPVPRGQHSAPRPLLPRHVGHLSWNASLTSPETPGGSLFRKQRLFTKNQAG